MGYQKGTVCEATFWGTTATAHPSMTSFQFACNPQALHPN